MVSQVPASLPPCVADLDGMVYNQRVNRSYLLVRLAQALRMNTTHVTEHVCEHGMNEGVISWTSPASFVIPAARTMSTAYSLLGIIGGFE